MAQSEAQLAVEKWCIQSQRYSINSNDALVTLIARGFETIAVVVSPASCNARIDHVITSLDSERKFALQLENKDFDILRHLCFGLIESLQVLLEVKGKHIEEQNQALIDEAPNSSLTIVEPKEEPIDPIDQLLEGNQLPIDDNFMKESLFKEEEMDIDFGVNNDVLPIENPLNDLPSNYKDSHGNIAPSDAMGDDMNSMEDPILDYSNPIVEGSLNNYRSLSVPAWYVHLHLKHSTSPRELSLALVCECGIETFSERHSLQCDISKITIVRKTSSPQCVMCEIYPKTPRGYANHLEFHHKISLKQKKIVLICSCGYKLRSNTYDPEHSKKCNGHEFTLHKLEDE